MIYSCGDALAQRMTAPGAPFETIEIGGLEVFRNHPRTLSGFYDVSRRRGAQRLIEVDGTAFSHDDIFAKVASLAEHLEARGVSRSTPVALALTAGVEWAVSFMAVTAIGAIAVLVNTRGSGDEMVHAIRAMDARFLIADAERRDRLFAEPDFALDEIIVSDEAGPGTLADVLAATPSKPFVPCSVAPEDGAIVLFTSGTTGRPKPVLIDHGAITHSILLAGLMAAVHDIRCEQEFGITVPPERASASAATLITSPVFHFSGVMPFLRGLYFGAPLIIMGRWSVDDTLGLMEREAVSRIGFVPAMLVDMLDSPRSSNDNLGRLLVLANGSATLDTQVVERVRSRLPHVLLANGYGQTESGAWGTAISGQDYLDHPNAVGYVLPTMRLRIVGIDGKDAAPGEEGEIWLAGRCLMQRYAGAPEATHKAMRDGWLRTGDVGKIDSNGRVFLLDRLKNMIISGGENVYCAEVERALGEHPAVAEAVAYGLPDERLGERVSATVVLKPGATASAEELVAHSRARLAGYKIPRTLEFRDTPLPRTSTMKIDRGRLNAERAR